MNHLLTCLLKLDYLNLYYLGHYEKLLTFYLLFRAGVPDVPTMVNMTECMPSSVLIKVTPPADNGGMPIVGYRVQYNDVSYDYSTGKPCLLLITANSRILTAVAPTPWDTGGTCTPRLQMAGHGFTVSRRTANRNWQNCTDHHHSAHQND